MAQLPPPTRNTVTEIYKAYEANQGDSRRPHLGASQIGKACERALWYSFRWARTIRHEGRLLRLFDSGNHEEPRLVSDLRAIGCEVVEIDPDTGRQLSVVDPDNRHFGGSMDGQALGIPEAPKKWHVLEFKTHGEKSFKLLLKDGVLASKPEHYAQMQIYMHFRGLTRALYLAKNKNTDELYSERIEYDMAYALQLVEKARRVTFAQEPPIKPWGPDYYLCKWCDWYDICHKDDQPERNCRTCMHSTPKPNGTWICERHDNATLELETQRKGCGDQRYIPALVPLEQTDYDPRTGDVMYAGWTDAGPDSAV